MHKEDNCQVPFCKECLDRIKQLKDMADTMHQKATPSDSSSDEEQK